MKLQHILPPTALLASLLLAGCSQDYVSYDDMRMQTTAEERFPISVVQEPVKMSIAAKQRSLSTEQVNDIANFARQASASGTSSITIAYAGGNRNGRPVALQTEELIVSQGVAREQVSTAVYNGSSAYVTLSYYKQIARTKDCGDWSENMAGNQFNEPYPNYGCAMQNNFAVMAENPEDLVSPRGLAPATGASRSELLRKYNTGAWSQKMQDFPDATTTQAAP